MPTYGPNSPGTLANNTGLGTRAWSIVANAGASDDAYAVAPLVSSGEVSNYLLATGFGFAIPSDEIIVGILDEFEWKGSVASNGRADSVRIYISGSFVGNDRGTGQIAGTTDAYLAVGGSTDTAGLTPTVAQMNDSANGVGISVIANSGAVTVSVDHIRRTVYTIALPASRRTLLGVGL